MLPSGLLKTGLTQRGQQARPPVKAEWALWLPALWQAAAVSNNALHTATGFMELPGSSTGSWALTWRQRDCMASTPLAQSAAARCSSPSNAVRSSACCERSCSTCFDTCITCHCVGSAVEVTLSLSHWSKFRQCITMVVCSSACCTDNCSSCFDTCTHPGPPHVTCLWPFCQRNTARPCIEMVVCSSACCTHSCGTCFDTCAYAAPTCHRLGAAAEEVLNNLLQPNRCDNSSHGLLGISYDQRNGWAKQSLVATPWWAASILHAEAKFRMHVPQMGDTTVAMRTCEATRDTRRLCMVSSRSFSARAARSATSAAAVCSRICSFRRPFSPHASAARSSSCRASAVARSAAARASLSFEPASATSFSNTFAACAASRALCWADSLACSACSTLSSSACETEASNLCVHKSRHQHALAKRRRRVIYKIMEWIEQNTPQILRCWPKAFHYWLQS